ncbi:MAG TPA: restriction endonuclease subunit S [Propionibacteriaceae bacterium]
MGAQAISSNSRGSTRAMINLEIFKAWPMPLPALRDQSRIVAQVQYVWGHTIALQQRLESQLALLHVHRQALIAAAVSGELDITGAA